MAFLITLLSLFLQAPAPPHPVTASIEGIVLRSGSNEPIANAQVRAFRIIAGPEGEYADEFSSEARSISPAASDGEGRFSIRDLEPGTYILKTQRNGFALQEYGERAPGRPGASLTVKAGQTIRDAVFLLVPGGAISGRVSDEAGEPITGIPVFIQRSRYGPNGKKTLELVGTCHTNDRGEYRVYGITPGRYYAVAKPWEAESEEMLEAGYVATYYPGSTDTSSASAIDVAPGSDVRTIDFTLKRQKVFRIRGRLSDAARGADNIHLFSKSLGPRGDTDLVQGTFEFRNIVPGSYRIDANWGEGKLATGHVDVFDADVENFVLPPYYGFSIMGRVQLEGASSPFKDGRPERMHLVEVSTEEDVYIGFNPDGTFDRESIEPGNYRLRMDSMPTDTYIKSARLGETDVLNGLSITGAVSEPLEILLSTRAGQIEGTIVDKERKAMPGIQAVLLPLREADRVPGRVKFATSDQNGKFILPTVPPGDYKLFGWEDLEPYAYFDPDFVRRSEALGMPVQISEDSKLRVELQIVPGQN